MSDDLDLIDARITEQIEEHRAIGDDRAYVNGLLDARSVVRSVMAVRGSSHED
jgi:hypothetical protein